MVMNIIQFLVLNVMYYNIAFIINELYCKQLMEVK